VDAGPQYLRIGVERDGDACTLTVVGDVDLSTSPQLKRALDEAFERDPVPSVVRADLSGVPFLDTIGLGLLLSARTRAEKLGSRFVVSSTSAALERLFDVAGVAAHLRGDAR
jgi:anti-anti-sigma factor